MTFRFQTAAAAAVLAIAAMPALANPGALPAVTASANLGPFLIQLYDLDPLDGLLPSITFDNSGASQISVTARVPSGTGMLDDTTYSSQPWSALTAVVSAGGSQARSSISGNGLADGTLFAASGSGSIFAATAHSVLHFSLSAKTVALVTSAASVEASAASTISVPDGGYLTAYAYLEMSGTGALGTGVQRSTDDITYSRGAAAAAGSDWSATNTLSASFANFTAASMTGMLWSTAHVDSSLVAAPVPEPETYALMLAGLAAVGMLARRRG